MSKNYIIKIQRTADGFQGIANGAEVDFDKISKIVEILKEDLEQALTVRNDVIARRQFVAYNDTLKGTDKYLGISKLAKKYGVSTGTISVDRKVITAKGIVGVAPQEEIAEEPAPETTPEPGKPGKKSRKNSKSTNGKK